MRTALATIVSNIGRWLNDKLGIIETDPEKNLYYDWADQSLDGLTSLSFEDWKERRDDPWYDWADQRLNGLTFLSFEEWLESRDCRPGSG